MNATRCTRCGIERTADGTPCPSCGSGDVSIEVVTGELLLVGERPGTVLADPKGHWLKVNAPSGSRSESSLVDGRVRTNVEGPVDMGTKGEPRVRDTLLSLLKAKGVAASWRTGIDRDGEDSILIIAGEEVTLQVSTAPRDPGFWRDAHVGSARRDVAAEQAPRWVHETLAHKAASLTTNDKARTLLAVDAHHFGPLASQEIVTSYLSQFGEPRQEFGFGAVYVVGPTPSSTTRLGAGNW